MKNRSPIENPLIGRFIFGLIGVFVFMAALILLLVLLILAPTTLGEDLGYYKFYVFSIVTAVPYYFGNILGAGWETGYEMSRWFVFTFYCIVAFFVAQLFYKKHKVPSILSKLHKIWKNMDKPPKDPSKND
ncbi:MAG: hypothetical protein PVJ39_21625 [Gammaproteobacteria bacterium]|jgi:hypothetical protein